MTTYLEYGTMDRTNRQPSESGIQSDIESIWTQHRTAIVFVIAVFGVTFLFGIVMLYCKWLERQRQNDVVSSLSTGSPAGSRRSTDPLVRVERGGGTEGEGRLRQSQEDDVISGSAENRGRAGRQSLLSSLLRRWSAKLGSIVLRAEDVRLQQQQQQQLPPSTATELLVIVLPPTQL